jgi:hypothetical protein
VAIARIDKVLKGFDRERGFNLKSYASITFANLIRELLRQQKEIDICSDWSLLRKLSQKRMMEALVDAGLDPETIESYVLAWNCLKTIYVPDRPSSTRKLAKSITPYSVKSSRRSCYQRESRKMALDLRKSRTCLIISQGNIH